MEHSRQEDNNLSVRILAVAVPWEIHYLSLADLRLVILNNGVSSKIFPMLQVLGAIKHVCSVSCYHDFPKTFIKFHDNRILIPQSACQQSDEDAVVSPEPVEGFPQFRYANLCISCLAFYDGVPGLY